VSSPTPASTSATLRYPHTGDRPAVVTGLPRDSVVNVTALVTLNKSELEGPVGRATDALLAEVDRGLRRVLGLSG